MQILNHCGIAIHAVLVLGLGFDFYLTLIEPGGWWNPPIGQEIACHFSQDHAMVTKILDFIHKHLKY